MPKAHLATEFTITLANKPGEMARVFSSLARAEVNIRAYTAYVENDHGCINLVPSDAESARQALSAANLAATEREVVVVEAPERLGIGAEIALRVSEAGVNITHSHASVAGVGTILLVLATSDNKKAVEVINR